MYKHQEDVLTSSTRVVLQEQSDLRLHCCFFFRKLRSITVQLFVSFTMQNLLFQEMEMSYLPMLSTRWPSVGHSRFCIGMKMSA